jgi:hypothetical protein
MAFARKVQKHRSLAGGQFHWSKTGAPPAAEDRKIDIIAVYKVDRLIPADFASGTSKSRIVLVPSSVRKFRLAGTTLRRLGVGGSEFLFRRCDCDLRYPNYDHGAIRLLMAIVAGLPQFCTGRIVPGWGSPPRC